ncbi:MAG: hypothetical protein ACREIB_02280 [Pseudomonadota bacterium]
MIAVHTLTRGDRGPWLDECVRSVPQGVRYAIVPCGNFVDDRWRGMTASDWTGFVDDDDRLVGDPIAACAAALQDTGAGVAFTWDRTVAEDGKPLRDNTYPVAYEDIPNHPYAVRQFSLVRAACLDSEPRRLADAIGPHVLDFALKARVALRHGAVQVPMIGYERRRHAGGMSRLGFREQWAAAQPTIQAWFAASGRRGPVPVWRGLR